MGAEQNKTTATATEFLAALVDGRGREAARLLSDDATWWVNGSTRYSGTHRVAQFLDLVRELFEDATEPLRMTFDTIVAEKNHVCIEAHEWARFAHERAFDNRVVYLFEIRSGKIAAIREYLDTDHVVRLFAGRSNSGPAGN